MVPGARSLTNTSLHLWVTGGSGTSAWTPDIPNTTVMCQNPLGVIQTPNLSAGSTEMSVRPQGISAVLAAGSVVAMDWVKIDTASLPGYVIATTQKFSGATTVTLQTSIAVGIAGMALESASTLQKFEMLIRPFVAFGSFE